MIGSIRSNEELFLLKINLSPLETKALTKWLPRYPVAPVNNIAFFTYASEAGKVPILG